MRHEIEQMGTTIEKLEMESDRTLSPSINSQIEMLEKKMSFQKDENTNLQKQLTSLKKDKAVILQKIMEAHTKIETLEEQVGI